MSKRRTIIIVAMTLVAVAAALAFIAQSANREAESMSCGNYMASIGCAALLWAGDHDDHLPPGLLSMSDELIATKILICPGDHSRQPAPSWAAFFLHSMMGINGVVFTFAETLLHGFFYWRWR